jgi:Arc/MetJ family transcription regulator
VAALRRNRLPAAEGRDDRGPSLTLRRLLRPLRCVTKYVTIRIARGSPMRTNIEIDDALMAEAQAASGHATKRQTVEQALRLMVRLRRQQEASAAFGKYRWRGNLARSRKGRGIG